MAANVIRSYYLDRPLTAEEVLMVTQAVGAKIEQVQIPHVFPAPDLRRSFAHAVSGDADAISSNLMKAGIRADAGTQVALVVPKDSHLYLVLSDPRRRAA